MVRWNESERIDKLFTIHKIMLDNKIEQYIESLLTVFPEYAVTEEDEGKIKKDKAQWITGKLLRKKFRKAKVADSTREDILHKIKTSIEENKPLHLIICFGGYKHFWNPSFPEVDWAELFNLAFMADYVAPILKVHSPGVILDYESEDVIMPLIDNYPEESLNAYAKSFQELILVYSKKIPANFKINYIRSQEQYDTSRLFVRLKEMLPEKTKQWDTLSQEEKGKRLHRTPRSIMWKGREDWTILNDREKRQKMEISKITNETYYEADAEFRGDYFTGDNHIPIVLSWGLCEENILNWLTLGSTYSSLVDFWTGRGIIENRKERFVPKVVSQGQYSKIRGKFKKIDTLKFVSLKKLKNFNSIEVYG